MTLEQERWAEAIPVHRMYGTAAKKFVIDRIADLAVAGDKDGVDRWMGIMRRLDQLVAGTLQ